jgi:GDP/UDP-N,N'-diacetylbacillosamine 2-epimerase (hydrolysing)
MATHKIKVGILTSSRADFGIYLPLLNRFKKENFIQFELIVFGSHLSHFHGYTLADIESHGFKADYKLDTQLVGDTQEAIATSMSLCMMKFSQFWGEHSTYFDIVFCLGDRFEMFAAVIAGVPFGIRFAHLHGGETTLGAIDNFFRHAISHASWCHFTSTQKSTERLKTMLDDENRIYFVGALALDEISQLQLLSINQVKEKWGIDITYPYILVTFHPETANSADNEKYAYELVEVFKQLSEYNLLINLPNADTAGATVRKIFLNHLGELHHVKLIESFGTLGYYTLMNYCSFLLGNSSSGILEAASFGKYVINIGDRQRGRLQSNNVLNAQIDKNEIMRAIKEIEIYDSFKGENIYYQDNVAEKIISILKQLLGKV